MVTYNSRAVKVYEKCGYKIEGTIELNHWNYITEEYGNEYKMGMILN